MKAVTAVSVVAIGNSGAEQATKNRSKSLCRRRRGRSAVSVSHSRFNSTQNSPCSVRALVLPPSRLVKVSGQVEI